MRSLRLSPKREKNTTPLKHAGTGATAGRLGRGPRGVTAAMSYDGGRAHVPCAAVAVMPLVCAFVCCLWLELELELDVVVVVMAAVFVFASVGGALERTKRCT